MRNTWIIVSFSDIIMFGPKSPQNSGSHFREPERANIPWRDVEALFVALGAEISEGSGSRVRAVFHRPHPRKETNKVQSSLFAGFWKRQESSHDGI